MVYRLAHKAYLKSAIDVLDKDIVLLSRCLEGFSGSSFEELLHMLPKHFDLLDPARVVFPGAAGEELFVPRPVSDGTVPPAEYLLRVDPDRIYEWASGPYCENTS